MGLDVIDIMAKHENICNYIHLPVQSGSSRILKLMNRGYDREKYLTLINNIKTRIPDCAISMDMITGFCGETEKNHQETLTLMDSVKYDFGYIHLEIHKNFTPLTYSENNSFISINRSSKDI